MVDKIFEFLKTGNKYRVVGEAIMKHPVTREWVECIIYKQLTEEKPLTFVREKSEFLERFKLVEI